MALAVASSGRLMIEPTAERNRRLRQLRAQGMGTRRLARELGISRARVVGLLRTLGDPQRLAEANVIWLEAERDRLRDRIRADRRRLRLVEEELESRRVDRLNGLAG